MFMKKRLVILFVGIILLCSFVFADVFINEVELNPNGGNEWIELYNDGAEQSLDSWEITDGVGSASLTGLSILDFLILERGTDFTFALADTGETLTLNNPTGPENEATVSGDSANDGQTHQRDPDGTGDFSFMSSTKGFTNSLAGKITIGTDSYPTIQAAIDAANPGDTISVAAGTYVEDLVIDKSIELVGEDKDTTTIKGIANLHESVWPLAAPNIDIQADGVLIYEFTIEGPDHESDYYASGIVLDGQDIEIYDNNFIVTTANSYDEISHAVTTYSKTAIPSADVSGLRIYDNNFMSDGSVGSEFIYINPHTGSGKITIDNNQFSGTVLVGASVESGNIDVTNNNIISDVIQGLYGMRFFDTTGSGNYDNIAISGNDIQNFDKAIRIGNSASGASVFVATVESNTLTNNNIGLWARYGADLDSSVHYNSIYGNSGFGVKNEITDLINAINNWWGDSSGPSGAGTGTGDAISDFVSYDPWWECLEDDDCNYLDDDYCDGTEIKHDEGVCNVDNQCEVQTTTTQDCDNGLWCDGSETCAAAACVAGTAPDCDDLVGCTVDTCDEINDECDNDPDDGLCDDGLACTGIETCDALLDCQAGTPVDCVGFDITAIGACDNDPDDIDETWDFRSAFTSVCQEPTGVCSLGDETITHDCSIDPCGAECEDGDVSACTDLSQCVGPKEQTRLLVGCDLGTCGCEYSDWGVGVCDFGCGALCEGDGDCPGNSCSETYDDYCDALKLVEYDSDKVLDSTTIDDDCDNVCEDTCGCSDCSVDCSAPATNEYCVKNVCGAECDINGHCLPYCSGNVYYDNGVCEGDCTCSYDQEDCDAYDNWYDTGATQWVNHTECTEKEQKEQENRDYSCSEPSGCDYVLVGGNQWVDTGVTRNKPDTTPCEDGLYCTVDSFCGAGVCIDGTARDCGDGVGCTVDSCDEDADVCVNTANDGLCDDGLWCNGAETCDDTLDCQTGIPQIIDDGVDCTIDSCDDILDVVLHEPNHGFCNNGLWCDGVEVCDVTLDCQDGPDVDCSDGVDCTDDSCDEATDSCENDPNDGLCDDGFSCTDDVCDRDDGCESSPNNALCGLGEICLPPLFGGPTGCGGKINITINLPDQLMYGTKRIPISVSINIEAETLEYIDWNANRPRWRRLCRNCDEYGVDRRKTKTFTDGFHKIGFRAVDPFGNSDEENITIFIDSRAPRISRILPRRNAVVNGRDFYLKYTEDNLEEITVSFNPTLAIEECNESGKNVECEFDLNLTDYHGEWLEFWFNFSDGINNVKSKETRVFVDVVDPELNLIMPLNQTYDERRVRFMINVSEEVNLEYRDELDSRPRWRRLCTRCDEYGVSRVKTKSFKKGAHQVRVRATDKAGNSDVEEVWFEIDY